MSKLTNSLLKFSRFHVQPIDFQIDPIAIPVHIIPPPWLNRRSTSQKFNSEQISLINSPTDISNLKIAAKAAARALKKAVELSETEQNGHDLDVKLTEFILSEDGYPSGIGFMGFPKSICISPNDVLVHGIPNKRPFQQGDFINLDVTVFKNGFYGDNSTMVTFGEVDPEIRRLVI